MLKSYKYYLITESSKREKTIEKYKDKILKFLNSPDIAQWIIDMCISNDSIKGIKYSLWVANQFKESLYHEIIKNTDEETAKNALLSEDDLNEWNPTIRTTKITFKSILSGIIDWLKSPIREEQVNLSTLTMKDAYEKSKEWHDNLKASGVVSNEKGDIVLSYDDGYYWIDLLESECREEADAMGHCATTNMGTLFSLRQNMKPHVTMSFNKKEGIIYQMKGKNNKKPVDKYHPYILDFLLKMDVKGFGSEYDVKEDFSLSDLSKEQFDKLIKEKPDIINILNIKMVYDLIDKKYIDYKDIINKKIDLTYKEMIEILYFHEDNKEFISFLRSLYNNSNLKSIGARDSEDNSLLALSYFFKMMLWYHKIISDKLFYESLSDLNLRNEEYELKYENDRIILYYDWQGYETERIDFRELIDKYPPDFYNIEDYVHAMDEDTLSITRYDELEDVFYYAVNKYFDEIQR